MIFDIDNQFRHCCVSHEYCYIIIRIFANVRHATMT